MKDKCGSNQTFSIQDKNQSTSVSISGLASGDTCFYKLKTKCGAPAFNVSNSTNIQVQYIQLDTTDVQTKLTKLEETIKTKIKGDLSVSMKASLETIDSDGLPPKDGNFSGTVVSDETTAGKVSLGISGNYSVSTGGILAWGNTNQVVNGNAKGKKFNISDSDCGNKMILLSVTAIPTSLLTSSRLLQSTSDSTDGSASIYMTSVDYDNTTTADDGSVEPTDDSGDSSSDASILKIGTAFVLANLLLSFA